MPASPDLHDPAAVAQLGQLDLIARMLVTGTMLGQHQSPLKGSSIEFAEHRPYSPGDELRHLDWRAFGKTEKYYVKEYEEESNLRATLALDLSGSMAYGASAISKFEYARILTAALAWLLQTQRDAVGLATFDSRLQNILEPSASPRQFPRIIQTLAGCRPEQASAVGQTLQTLAPRLPRRSLIFLISDFFDDLQTLQQGLHLCRQRRHEVLLLQVLAPEEIDFPFRNPTQFRSLEQVSHRILGDPHRLRAVYLEQFAKFQEQLRTMAGRCGFDLLTLKTSEPFQQPLGAYLDWRRRRPRSTAFGGQ